MLNRRKFINLSSTTSTLLMANSLELLPFNAVDTQNDYKLLIFATNWGFGGSWQEFADKIKKDGYDGAEFWFPSDTKQREEIFSVFKKNNLQYGFLLGGQSADYQEHLKQFKTNLEAAVMHNPVYINCHSGRDYFTFEQNKAFMDLTSQIAKSSGIPIYHETHRGRILFAASVSKQYFEKFADLKLTLDISHWCNVHESLLADQVETVEMALSRTSHIHARIGHPEGPQVNDPRAPEWKNAVAAHFAWWDKVVAQKKKEGKLMTFLTEFGPVDYLPALPYTRQPVANQWEINKFMMETLRSRYA
jgi:sugar phosphate isomerase/epimerase